MNTSALVYQIAALNTQDNNADVSLNNTLLDKLSMQQNQAQQEALAHAEKGFSIAKTKERLKFRMKSLSLKKNIQEISSRLKNLVMDVKHTQEQQARGLEMVRKIIHELDDTKNSLQQERQSAGAISAAANSGAAVGMALKAEVGQKYDGQKEERSQKQTQNQQQMMSLGAQIDGIKKQIKALSGLSIFNKVIKIAGIVVGAVVTAVTAMPALAPLAATAIGMISKQVMGLVGAAGSSHYGKQIKQGQLQEQNQGKNYLRLSDQRKKQEADFQQSQQRVQGIIRELSNN